MGCDQINHDSKHSPTIVPPTFTICCLVFSIAFMVTSFLIVPTPLFLYSSTKGSIMLKKVYGKRAIKTMTV